jgi:hypothetical protein
VKVFLTGATGYIGSVVAEKLRAAGHGVLGLAHSDEAASKLEAAGVEPVRGALLDSESVGRGSRAADGATHAARARKGPSLSPHTGQSAHGVRGGPPVRDDRLVSGTQSAMKGERDAAENRRSPGARTQRATRARGEV